MDKKVLAAAYNELLSRCWKDAAYLESLRSDPAAALKEYGIPTVEGASYHVVDQTADHIYFVVPEDTSDEKIAELTAQLRASAGEGFTGTAEVLRNTAEDVYVIYHPAPVSSELSDDALDSVAGGRDVDIVAASPKGDGYDWWYPWNWEAPYHPVI